MIRTLIAVLLSATPVLAQAKPAGGMLEGFLPMMLVMFAAVYFLMIRPERKKQKNRLKMINEIKKGDKVVTIGGIIGIVGTVKDSTLTVKTGDDTIVEVRKSGIAEVVIDKVETAPSKDSKK